MMRTALGVIMISNATLFLFGAVQHAGIPIGRFHEPEIIPAAVVESICGSFLLWGSIVIFAHLSNDWKDGADRQLGCLGWSFARYGRAGSGKGSPNSEQRPLSSHHARIDRRQLAYSVLRKISIAEELKR